MAKPGVKPLPSAVKLARGTYRPDRAVKSNITPAPLEERPSPPAILDSVGKAKWDELLDWLGPLKLIEARFLDAMEMYCRAWDRLYHYEKEYKGKEFTTVDSGYVCAHPAIGLAKQARDEIRRYQVEFGFTPSSAGSVNASAPAKEKTGVPSRRRDLA